MRPRLIATLVAAPVLLSDCGGSDRPPAARLADRGTAARSAAGPDKLVAAPRWIRRYCRKASAIIRRPVLCPQQVPPRIGPGPNASVFRPSPSGLRVRGLYRQALRLRGVRPRRPPRLRPAAEARGDTCSWAARDVPLSAHDRRHLRAPPHPRLARRRFPLRDERAHRSTERTAPR